MLRTHKIRLNPTTEQVEQFIRAAGIARFAWNWALSDYKACKERSEIANWNEAKKRFRAAIASDYPFVREVTKCAFEEAIHDLRRSIATYYKAKKSGSKRLRFPGFRSRKKRIGGFGIANDKFTCINNIVKLPKIGAVNMTEPLRFTGKVMSGRVVENGGHWYLVVLMEVEKPTSTATGSVGIDFGLKTFAVCSDGKTYETQAGYRKGQRKLKSLQRGLSRKKQHSKNYQKWKMRVAKFQGCTANRRNDYLHKMTSEISTRYEVVCVEDLNLKGLCRTRLAKSFYDAAIGSAVRMLEYKAQVFQKVGRFYPSSRLCRSCGCVNKSLTLSDRTWECLCGVVHDRDFNASVNIELEGVNLLAQNGYMGVTTVELATSTDSFGMRQVAGCEAVTNRFAYNCRSER
jgi:putative transposase